MRGKVAIVTGGAGGDRIRGKPCIRRCRRRRGSCRRGCRPGPAILPTSSLPGTAERSALRLRSLAKTPSKRTGAANGRSLRAEVDFLVHCAGNNIRAPVLELSAEDWSRALNTHLTGAFLFSKAVGKTAGGTGRGRSRSLHVVGRREGPGARARSIHSGQGGA